MGKAYTTGGASCKQVTSRSGSSRYRKGNRALPNAGLPSRDQRQADCPLHTEPSELPADIYSQLAEFIPSDDDIVDLDVSAFLLPGQDDGTSD